jgi:iron complex outermembrane receptor protein
MKTGGALPALGLGLLSVSLAGTAAAADANDADQGNSLAGLEQVTVYAPGNTGGVSLGGASVTRTDMQQFNRDTLDRAFVLASGTSVSLTGAGNETNISIRGFDRWRVPLYQDGIPVYLAYDNRIDFSRFNTIDLASVDVSKGFASAIDGPGAMGGSVNLVSRVASKPFEGEARHEEVLDSHGSHAESIGGGSHPLA